jgi:hypothetical protein
MVHSPPSLIRADRSWSSWNYYWAGNTSDQDASTHNGPYRQQLCSRLWASGMDVMLLGWVDIKSTYPQVSGQFGKRWNADPANGLE